MHYYNDVSSFLLLIKEVLQRVQSEYDTIQTEPINIHLPSLLLVFLFSVESFSFFSAAFSCVFETEIRAGWETTNIKNLDSCPVLTHRLRQRGEGTGGDLGTKEKADRTFKLC